jgi:hypothetical protein
VKLATIINRHLGNDDVDTTNKLLSLSKVSFRLLELEFGDIALLHWHAFQGCKQTFKDIFNPKSVGSCSIS